MSVSATPEASDDAALRERVQRMRLHPDNIAERLGDGYTPERIVEMIHDVENRKELAETILQEIPEASEHYGDVEALNYRLGLMSEILPQKKRFFDNVKEKASWAMEKVKNVVTHPVVVTILVGLLAWWAWGHIHEVLALAHGEAAEAGAARLGTMGEGAGAISPEMGEGLLGPGGGTPPPSTLDQFKPKLPSSGSPPPPKGPRII